MSKKLIMCVIVLISSLFICSWPSLSRDSAEVFSSVSVPEKEKCIVSEPFCSNAPEPEVTQRAQEDLHDYGNGDARQVSFPDSESILSAGPEAEEKDSENRSSDSCEIPTNNSAAVFPYSDNVSRGTVRYVSQLMNPESNGWGKYAWKAGMECTTACISMALSYLGIDTSPESILDYSSKTVLKSCYGIDGISCSELTQTSLPSDQRYSVFKDMFGAFRLDPEQRSSPVLIYLSGNGNHHAVLVIGCGEDNTLDVLDPANEGIHHITVNEDGELRTEDSFLDRYTPPGDGFPLIESLAQWCLSDPS